LLLTINLALIGSGTCVFRGHPSEFEIQAREKCCAGGTNGGCCPSENNDQGFLSPSVTDMYADDFCGTDHWQTRGDVHVGALHPVALDISGAGCLPAIASGCEG